MQYLEQTFVISERWDHDLRCSSNTKERAIVGVYFCILLIYSRKKYSDKKKRKKGIDEI